MYRRAFSNIAAKNYNSVDVHTHMYLPKYMDILLKRTTVPRVIEAEGVNRLVILPGEDAESTTAIGRPIGREYYDVQAKLKYMDVHGIQKSVISLANPWLDFLTGNEAASVAQELNDELQRMCEESNGRLFGFATLPVKNPVEAVKEVHRLKSLSHIRGVILGTPGAGDGIDHENMRDVLAALEDQDQMIFLHPHYGIGNEQFHDTGHALFLALGFPFETTVAVSRLITSGTLDKLPKLKLLVAHAGATLPSLIGRLDSCVDHDAHLCDRLKQSPSDYMKQNMYFDAISYSTPGLKCLIETVGEDRIMFGTDNPFFPPLGVNDVTEALWPSTVNVYDNIDAMPAAMQSGLLRGNAERLLKL